MAAKKKKNPPLGDPSPALKDAVESAKSNPAPQKKAAPNKKAAPKDDPYAERVKEIRAKRRQENKNKDGTPRKETTRTPKPEAKPKNKIPLKDGMPIDPYDARWEQELQELISQDESRIDEELSAGLGEGSQGGVGTSRSDIFDLPARQRARALRGALAKAAGDFGDPDYSEGYYTDDSDEDAPREVFAGLDPSTYGRSEATPYEEADEYAGDAEATGRLSSELSGYGAGFDNPEIVENEDPDVLDPETGAVISGAPSSILAPNRGRPGRGSEEDVRTSQVLGAQRRAAELDARLTRSRTTRTGVLVPIRELPASLPVTPEEVLANQNYFDPDDVQNSDDTADRGTIRTDNPPTLRGIYKDRTGAMREGIISRPNRGYIVPPSVQDTRRRRQRSELENLAKGSAALADVVSGATDRPADRSSTIKKTTKIKRVPKVSIAPGQVGEVVAQDVTETTGMTDQTTFGDVEQSLTAEQQKAISSIGASPSGLPTNSSREGFLRYLRPRALGPAGTRNVLGQQLQDFSNRATNAALNIDVEPPLDENYDYEIAGMGSAKDLLEPAELKNLIEVMRGSTNRRYTPFTNPAARPTTTAGLKAAGGGTTKGIPLGKDQQVTVEEGVDPNIARPEIQGRKSENDPYRDIKPGTIPAWRESLLAQDAEQGLEPGTKEKQLAKQFNLPDISEMELEDVIGALQGNPRAVMVTPSEQVSRPAAANPNTPAAKKARDTARAETGGPRGTVKRLRILRNRAKELGSGQAGLEDVDSTEATAPKAEVVLGGNRETTKIVAQQMSEFPGAGGGERDRAGLIRPGSGATQERMIVRNPGQSWAATGAVPIVSGSPKLTDRDRAVMETTHPGLASALDPATGMGRVVITNKEGQVTQRPIENPGTVKNVPINVPGGQEYGETVVSPMPVHLATQFNLHEEGHETLPMVAGNPYKDSDWTSPSTGRGFRRSRVLTPEETSDPEALRRSPAVRRAAAEPRRMAGITEAKRVSDERKSVKTPEEKASEELSARRTTRRQKIDLAKRVSIEQKRSAYESQPTETQDAIRANTFIQSPSVERQRSTPAFMQFLGDYARQTGNLYRDNPDFSLTNVNKPGRERAVQQVPQSVAGGKMDIAGSLRETLTDKFVDTMKARSGYVAPSNPRNVVPRATAPEPSPTYADGTGDLKAPTALEAYSSYVTQKSRLTGQPTPSGEEITESAYGGNPALATPLTAPAMTGSQFSGVGGSPNRTGVINPRTTPIGPRKQRPPRT